MLRGFFGNLIFAIIARILCGNHLKLKHHCYLPIRLQNFLRYCGSTIDSVSYIARLGSDERHASRETRRTRDTREAPTTFGACRVSRVLWFKDVFCPLLCLSTKLKTTRSPDTRRSPNVVFPLRACIFAHSCLSTKLKTTSSLTIGLTVDNKNEALPSILNQIRSVWISDETLSSVWYSSSKH